MDNPVPEPVVNAVDYELLAQTVLELLAEDARFKGKDGTNGTNGTAGANGKDGKDGSSVAIDLDKLSKEVDKRLPPLTIQIVDRQGKVMFSESRKLGEKLQILFQPKGK